MQGKQARPKQQEQSFEETARTLLEQGTSQEVDEAAEEKPPVRASYDYTLQEDRPLPDWVVLPSDFAPPKGRVLGHLLFRSQFTDYPEKGDRQCTVWNLTSADEKLALRRTRGEAVRTLAELSKQMVRAIDGCKVDWTGRTGPGNVEIFWDELGARCREQIQNYYIKTHTMSASEQADFFANCIDIRTAM